MTLHTVSPGVRSARGAGRYKRPSVTETPFPLKGQDWLRARPDRRENLVEVAFRFWRRHGFPHYELSTAVIETEFRQLLIFDWKRAFVGNRLQAPSLGLRLANSFHPAMWSVRVSRYRSPVDVFQDDTLLRSAIRRAFAIWPKRYSANASCLRRILKTFSGTASVSNFKPLIAKAIIAKYSKPGDLVIDFCAGYGGRLLGCLTLPREFVGIEPCKSQVSGLKRMIRMVSKFKASPCAARILQGCAEDRLRELPSRSAALVFSSPPYFNWERYANHSTQSFVRYKSYPEWLENFLKPVIAESSRLLRKQGHFVLNVSNGKRTPTRPEVARLAQLFGLYLKGSHDMVVPKVPYLHPRNGLPEKCECVLVFARS